MVPKVNSPGHLPACTAFKGRVPNYKIDAPYAFGTAGFLQRAPTHQSNTAQPRADYCIWLGTTCNLKGTHKCLNVDTLRIVTGDTFRPAPFTHIAISRLQLLAGKSPLLPSDVGPPEVPLPNPNMPYALDPNRGVDNTSTEANDTDSSVIVGQVDVADLNPAEVSEPVMQEEEHIEDTFLSPANALPTDESNNRSTDIGDSGVKSNNDEDFATGIRNSINAGYNRRQSTQNQHVYAALTIKDAKSQFGAQVTDDAIVEELKNLLKKEVFTFLPPSQTTKAIPSKMILTPKKLPNGQIDRMKARLVAGGHRQDRSMYKDEETSSPTVALSSVLIAASVAAHRSEHVMTLDHKAAYLNAPMGEHTVHVRMRKEVSTLLCKLAPTYTKFIREDGTIIVKLRRALYGCIESAVLWYKELSTTILGLGFYKNPYDECSFVRNVDGRTDSILVYVDDLMILSKVPTVLTSIAEALRTKYTEVTVKLGLQHDFLGIHWDFGVPGQVVLSMDGYVDNILEKYNVTKKASTPATDNLFISNPLCPKLSKGKQEVFHSCVMELHYLAKRLRYEILTAVSYCATKVLSPDEDDEKKLDRILSYLLLTRDQVLTLRIGSVLEIRAYVDASFGTYKDMKSVTGVVIKIGDATIYIKSGKQKIVTRSSTEAELVGLSDVLSQILWTRELVIHQGIPVGPAIIYQDNQSTICLANKGKSTSERTRHIKVRYFFIGHYVDRNEVVIKYLPTQEMVADLLTKPLHGPLFVKLKGLLVGNNYAKD